MIMPSQCTLTNARALRTVMRDYRRSRAELEPLISKRLRKILVPACQHVPYYRDVMSSAGYDPVRDYRGPADLQHLPILTKELLKQQSERRFVREDADVERFFQDATSGSTGTPLQVWRSPMARSLQVARWLRVLMINGYRLTDKVLSFTSPARLNEGQSALQRIGLLRRKAVDYCLSPEELLQAVVAYRPEVIYGNRSQLDLVAHEVMKSGAKLPPIKLVVVGAEIVRNQHRRLYKEVYQAKVIEFYGSVELGIIAFESPRSAPGLEICEDQIYYEFLNQDDQPARPGEMCRPVMTDLANDLMPFLRYCQGDWLELAADPAVDGGAWRSIRNIQGRDDDSATLPGGQKVRWHPFYEVMDGYLAIRQFRIIQHQEDQFEVLVAAEPDYVQSIRRELLADLSQCFPQHAIEYAITRVDHLEPDPSGKLRMLVSEVGLDR